MWASTDVMFTTAPVLPGLRSRVRRMAGTAALLARNGPVELTRKTSSHSDGSRSSKALPRTMPALFTSTSRPPKASSVRRTASSMLSSSVTSATTGSAFS